ncbi:MAG TPA: response regulator, partial [Saprospiraceae bacterium]|nr:response regulator [Saprospiraceae bacterium]
QGYDKNIIAIFEDSKKNLYKGTLTEGLYVKKPASKTFEKIKQIPNVKVNVIYEKFNMFFVGTSQGLFVTNDNNFNRIKHYFPNEKITTILLDSKQRLWISTQERGLYLVNDFDELIKEVEVFSETHPNNALDNNRISKIIEDATGNIWLGTYAGLNKYDEVNKKIISQDKLLVDFIKKSIINDIFIDKDKIYLATPQGLIILIFDKLKKRLDVEKRDYSGISDNFLCAIQKDNEGSIWLSSSNTLIKYDTESKNSIIFSRVDGVLINSFHIASSFKDLNGHLYFGGSNGLIKFDPKNINTTTTVPDVIFTKILVNNKEVDINEEVNGNLILENSLVKTNEISLKHFQNNINLRFAVNDLLGADQIKYQYSLSKWNDNWIELGTRNEVNFTNLQSGKYSVSIRASRNNLDWSSVATMSFTIATPPWLSWYAIFIYGLIFLGFIAIFNFLYLRQEKLKGQLELVRIEKEKEHELNEAKLIFFTNISHEFKTPLTLILSPVIELLNSHKLQRDVKDRVTIIEKNARKMLRLINQLIDFRKSEHGILTLNIKVNNLIELIQRIYNDFKPMAKEKNIQMSLSIDCNHCEYHYDEMQLEIVLNNLLSNALKYTNEGGFIAMSLTKNEAYIEINIKDTGIGISEDDKDKIFDRFYQTENSKFTTDNLLPTIGSGIGLTFTKKIVELHNGFISLESKVGEGSNFKVSLPLELGYNSYHNIQDSALQESEVRHEKNKTKIDEMVTTSSDNDVKDNNEESAEISILIVDDNDGIRQYLSTLLMTTYKIIEAKDGFEALEVVNEKYPDIIVCDVMMPKMDGIQFCKRIKKNISTSHIPIILLTARTAEIYQLEGLQTGADDYITKPFNPEILKTKISNLLFNRAKIREYFQNKMRFEPNSEIIIDDSKLDQEFINKIVLHIENNIQNPELNINNLTAEFHMSRSSLFRKIKSLTGLSLTGLIKTIKLKKAAQLILQSDLKLSTIAYETGFNDYKYFKLSFKEQFSCLPSEYKSKILTK